MKRREILAGAAAMTLLSAVRPGMAQDGAQDGVLKLGLIVPMTGPFATYGQQMDIGTRMYLDEHGDSVAGRRVQITLADDGGVADTSKRIAQEMITRQGVEVLAGFGLTPLAMAVGPLSARARVPQLVLVAATSAVTEQSPYIVRLSYTTPQVTSQIAKWVTAQGITRAATLVTDYGPGLDAERTFTADFTAAGGEIVESLRVPLQNPEFAPFLQRVADRAPQALFVFVPTGLGTPLLRQFVERGLDKAGIQLIADGSTTDDLVLPEMGDAAIGMVTGFHYSASHDSELNRRFVAEYMRRSRGVRPSFIAVAAYDAMHMLYEGLRKTGGDASGPAFTDAVRGMEWESPRGPIGIDPETRDIVQNIYMRRVEKIDGQLWNTEFETYESVRDPGKAG